MSYQQSILYGESELIGLPVTSIRHPSWQSRAYRIYWHTGILQWRHRIRRCDSLVPPPWLLPKWCWCDGKTCAADGAMVCQRLCMPSFESLQTLRPCFVVHQGGLYPVWPFAQNSPCHDRQHKTGKCWPFVHDWYSRWHKNFCKCREIFRSRFASAAQWPDGSWYELQSAELCSQEHDDQSRLRATVLIACCHHRLLIATHWSWDQQVVCQKQASTRSSKFGKRAQSVQGSFAQKQDQIHAGC